MAAIKATNQSNSFIVGMGAPARRSTLGMTQMHTDETKFFSGGRRQFNLVANASKCMTASSTRSDCNYSRSLPS